MTKKKELSNLHKIPRKIIRNFITACNNAQVTNITVNLDEKLIYRKINGSQQLIMTTGIDEFKEYLNSPDQLLCSRNIKIKSSWTLSLPRIVIRVNYGITSNVEKNYGIITFIIENDKIIRITEGG